MVALVLLPGMDGTGALFADFVTALGSDVESIVVSYPESQPLDYHALEDFARAALPTDAPFVLLGESFSGPVAISLAASRPSGLVGLVLCCTFARNPAPFFRPLYGLVGLLPMTSKLTGLIAPLLLGRFSTAGLRGALRHVLARVPASTLRARLRAVLDVDFSDKLKETRVPILYLQASEDRIVPPSASRHVARQNAGVNVVTLIAPHLLLQAIPAEAATVIKKFVHESASAIHV